MTELTILIASYHGSNDYWQITANSFEEFWPNNPYEVILGANGCDQANMCPRGWTYMNNGSDLSWATSMLSYLENIKTKFVLVHIDDFAILKKVDNEELQYCFEYLKSRNGKMLRLFPKPKPDYKVGKNIGLIDVGRRVPYVTSLQSAIWDRKFMIELLKEGFDPWEFETQGGKTTIAMSNQDKFYGVYKPVIHSVNFVEKGKYLPIVRNLVTEHMLKKILEKRDIWSHSKMNDNLYSRIFNCLPNKYQNRVRRMLKMHEL